MVKDGSGRLRSGWIVLGLVAPLLSGCESWRRPGVRGVPLTAGERVLADPVANDPSFAKPAELEDFFRGGRLQGTLSSEARDVEKSLGVND
ncbi:MAG: hypothetical protein KatS3mg108_0560 [Isosphaeraceae bacterium]|jgi:hypothetical protein|nr:MAG: hypothetical protein KatS3mg108_0560 [Isosphaeraceae bacterium]